MSLVSLLNRRPPQLRYEETLGTGATATVEKAVVLHPGGCSKLHVGDVIAVKKVYIPPRAIDNVMGAAAATFDDSSESDTGSDSGGKEEPHHHQHARFHRKSRKLSAMLGDENDALFIGSQDALRCKAIQREVALLKNLSHPHIVSCFGVTVLPACGSLNNAAAANGNLSGSSMLGILMEYCGGLSLRHAYRRRLREYEDQCQQQGLPLQVSTGPLSCQSDSVVVTTLPVDTGISQATGTTATSATSSTTTYVSSSAATSSSTSSAMATGTGGNPHQPHPAAYVPFHPGLPEPTVRRYTRQMLEGLVYLHARGVVHRDLKGLNVLLSADEEVCKLADFGAAVEIARKGRDVAFHSMQGTVWWMAPEQFVLGAPGTTEKKWAEEQQQQHHGAGIPHHVDASTTAAGGGSYSADIWSLGATVLEIATGAIPFSHVPGGPFGLMVALSRPECDLDELVFSSVSSLLSDEVKRFIRRCLVREPSRRPTALELLRDPWIMTTTTTSAGGADSAMGSVSTKSLSPPRMIATPSTASSTAISSSAASPAAPSTAVSSPRRRFSVSDAVLEALLQDVPYKLQSAATHWVDVVLPYCVAQCLPAHEQQETSLSWASRPEAAEVPLSWILQSCHLQSMTDVIAPLVFGMPSLSPSSVSSGTGTTYSQTQTVSLSRWLSFIAFFGPLELLLDDLRALESESYAGQYSNSACYAGYEATDGNHLLLTSLSKSYCQLPLSQQAVEAQLQQPGTLPGSFVVRYSSGKAFAAPPLMMLDHTARPSATSSSLAIIDGTLTLSVRGDRGVNHLRLLRPAEGWGFQVPRQSTSTTSAAATAAGGASKPIGSGTELLLTFDTLEEVIKYFAKVGVPSQRKDKRYKLIVA